MSLLLNILIAAITAFLLLCMYIRGKKGQGGGLKYAFRFFTMQSNAFCGLTALLMCFFPHARWAFLLKFMGTAALTLTMLTVLFYLAPLLGSLKKLLEKESLFLHLLTPLMALASFCIWEKKGLGPWQFLLGAVPVVLYGILYLKKVVITKKEDGAWEDFYGFNRGGKWPLSLAAMLTATLLICLGLSLLQNCS